MWVCVLCVLCLRQPVETSKDGLKAMGAHVSGVYKSTIRKWRCDTNWPERCACVALESEASVLSCLLCAGVVKEVGLPTMSACRSGMAQAGATAASFGCTLRSACGRLCEVLGSVGRWLYGVGASAYSGACAAAMSLWALVW